MTANPRTRRLRADYQHMLELSGHSDFIDFEVTEDVPGTPPEKYVVRLKCRGIGKIKSDKQPEYSEFHQILVYLDSNYPVLPPRFRWLTPIWHPNIEHDGLKRVNKGPWAAAFTLDRTVLILGEMVQYKKYHAKSTPPDPTNREAAEWVLWAEKEGILSPSKPVDERELLRPPRVKGL